MERAVLIEQLYVWPLVESTHVLTLGLFVGTTVMMDPRLAGLAFRGVSAESFTGRLLPWTHAGFIIMTVTGLLLFYSQPLRYYHNLFYRVKVLVLIAAGVNAFIFHRGAHRHASEWGDDALPPRAPRVAGAVSLTAWTLVVVTGRLIAYNWFDCDIQPQPGWVNWMAGCAAGTPRPPLARRERAAHGRDRRPPLPLGGDQGLLQHLVPGEDDDPSGGPRLHLRRARAGGPE